eukprot:CAMPEP_0181460500 /NCGR_PEP_ID=MMETSP1110-20121109/33374_1 /TAXON_ID=174948 /ORGANISM="Symbiodinium sp., Strain CCMP421" /LENGTH=94 /DNA_ID=CAMNT_0023585055 /DNA_START=204 /DNA_END=488 /DNA_ORIENTATION=-
MLQYTSVGTVVVPSMRTSLLRFFSTFSGLSSSVFLRATLESFICGFSPLLPQTLAMSREMGAKACPGTLTQAMASVDSRKRGEETRRGPREAQV